MHITQSVVQLQLCYHFCNCLLLIGVLGGCVSFGLALLTLYGAIGIRSAMFLSISGVFGLTRLVLPPWPVIGSDDGYISTNDTQETKLCDLAVDTRTLRDQSKKDCSKGDETSCSVCLQAFEIGQEISVVSECRHVFHSSCLLLWAQKSTTCPYCRQDMEKRIPREESQSPTGNRCRFPGAPGVFDGALDSIFDLAA